MTLSQIVTKPIISAEFFTLILTVFVFILTFVAGKNKSRNLTTILQILSAIGIVFSLAVLNIAIILTVINLTVITEIDALLFKSDIVIESVTDISSPVILGMIAGTLAFIVNAKAMGVALKTNKKTYNCYIKPPEAVENTKQEENV